MLGLGVEVVTVVNESYLLLRRPIIVSILRILCIIYILYSSSMHRAGVRTSCTRARPSTVGLSKHTRVWILFIVLVCILVVEYEFAPILYPGGSNLTAGKCPNIYY